MLQFFYNFYDFILDNPAAQGNLGHYEIDLDRKRILS